MYHQLLHPIAHLLYFVNALCALHVGVMQFGYNVLAMPALAGSAMYINYAFGISGILSLVFLVMHGFSCACSCKSK